MLLLLMQEQPLPAAGTALSAVFKQCPAQIIHASPSQPMFDCVAEWRCTRYRPHQASSEIREIGPPSPGHFNVYHHISSISSARLPLLVPYFLLTPLSSHPRVACFPSPFTASNMRFCVVVVV